MRSKKAHFWVFTLLVMVAGQVSAQTAPELLTEDESAWAIALDSVTRIREPFPIETSLNFSADNRTRVKLFAKYVELLPGEGASAVIAQAEDLQQKPYVLDVEYVGSDTYF